MADDLNLLDIRSGMICAPAGCGKTQLITSSLKNATIHRPVLLLTHTNAGVSALRQRLNKQGVQSLAYKISTIDGFMMRLASAFPIRSQCPSSVLAISNPATDYGLIRDGAIVSLHNGDIADIMTATYSHVIVDEYQDCSRKQHSFLRLLSQVIPLCGLGDPMQAIFGFGSDPLPPWGEVCTDFPVAEELFTPWRWNNAGANELGEWLLDARRKLLEGKSVSLENGPKQLDWRSFSRESRSEVQIQSLKLENEFKGYGSLIIGSSKLPASHRTIASRTHDAVVVEAVDLKDFIAFSRVFSTLSNNSFSDLMAFAESVMSNVGAGEMPKRLDSLRMGRARKPATELETLALNFISSPSYKEAQTWLVEMSRTPGVRIHKEATLRACHAALSSCISNPNISFHQAALRARDQNRFCGRPIPRRAVGSTLLLKGLESDAVIILDTEDMSPANKYVAITRGSRLLRICSVEPKL